MCFNSPMNTPIKKKLSTSNPGINLKQTDNKKDSTLEGGPRAVLAPACLLLLLLLLVVLVMLVLVVIIQFVSNP